MFDYVTPFSDFLSSTSMSESSISDSLKRWNPDSDVTIDELQQLRKQAAMEYAIRTGHFRKTYWARLSPDELLFAEAEAEYCKDLYLMLSHAEYLHMCESKLDKVFEVFDNWLESGRVGTDVMAERRREQREAEMIMQAESRNWQVMSPSAVQIATTQIGCTLALVPTTSPIHGQYMEHLRTPERIAAPPILINPVTREAQEELSQWRERVVHVQNETHVSVSRMTMDILQHETYNQIPGRNVDGRILLVNKGIPLPSIDSFLGWFSHAGIAFRALFPGEKARTGEMCRFTPHWILTYMLPAMPMTKEHVAHNLVQTVDSTASHSLQSKNSAHRRTGNGSILFGQWRVRTVLIGKQPGEFYIVGDQPLPTLSVTPMSIHEQHLFMLPGMKSTLGGWYAGGYWNRDMLLPGCRILDIELTSSPVNNPSVEGAILPIHWPLIARDLIMPWASLSKYHRLHFRFDWTEEGNEAAADWTDGFETTAQRWAMSSRVERTKSKFRNAVAHTRYLRKGESEVVVKTAKGTTSFDLSGF